MTNTEEAGLLKRLDEFLNKTNSSTTVTIEKNYAVYTVGYAAEARFIQGSTLDEALEKFLGAVKTK
jgi:hypothetical protein